MTGGYEQIAHRFGVRVDYLLATKIVNTKSDIVEADKRIIKGIWSARGN
jgi:hypothetical protein